MLSTDLRHNHVGVGTRIVGVVQGYRPQVDWGGDSGSPTIVVGGHNVRVATSGWRRRCLYILLLALLALSVINLSLTLWILKTIHFNVDGMGQLHVVVGGVRMQGSSRFMEKIAASSIMSKRGQDLPVNGYHNLTILTAPFFPSHSSTSENHLAPDKTFLPHQAAFLHLNVEGALAGTKRFTVRGLHGDSLFESSSNGSRVGAERLTVTGHGGAEFSGTIQTPLLYSQGVHELRVESVTRGVEGHAADEVRVEARDGDISATSLKQASLVAQMGVIRLDNPNIFMPKLPARGHLQEATTEEVMRTPATASPPETQVPAPERARPPTTPIPPLDAHASTPVQVYQVCVCPSGRLFLVTAASACVPDDDVCR
ncbi:delta-sarcoglycan [Procambarus clarkii]|uniref:delta-sarcoglycan n=1 Tax=Procambarus clarkii TaxID=6728 RepID=UPI00374460B1